MTPGRRRIAEGGLFTDFYQLTMAQAYFRHGLHEKAVQFDYFFRNYPDYGDHRAGYCVTAGLEWLLDWMRQAHFGDEELSLLRRSRSRSGKPLFDTDFLSWLKAHGTFEEITLQAVPEGRVVHPNTPLAVVRGPFAMAQILETPLLNHLNYPTLVATKAARVKQAARGAVVMDFGMRRGHERGVNAGTRAALVGGVDFSSNTGLSYELGFPPKGTHAHSMVQAYMALGESELGAFRAYAECYPDDCLLLVDTIDTLASGVPNAITVFEELRRRGHRPLGIRLDSGDLAHLSIKAAKMLDEAGFEDAIIVLSNQLDEFSIWQILRQIEVEAPSYGVDADRLMKRLSYGVGTRLITSSGSAALDGVYKLVAIEREGSWKAAIKLSETPSKILTPGDKRVWRVYDARGKATADLLVLADEIPRSDHQLVLHHPSEQDTLRILPAQEVAEVEPLLCPVLREGKLVYEPPSIPQLRQRCQEDLARLDPGVKRLLNPHVYHVSLSPQLWRLKQELIRSSRRP